MKESIIRICSVCNKIKTEHSSGICSICRRKDGQARFEETNMIEAKVIEHKSICPLCGHNVEGELVRISVKL